MKKLFQLSVIAVLFTALAVSCSNDPSNEGPGPGPGPVDGKGYFSFTMGLPTPPPSSRASAGDTDPGLEAERIVNDVTVLLYDATGEDAVLRYKFDLEAQNFTDASLSVFDGDDVASGTDITPATTDRFVSVGRLVDYQDYQMVVLINRNSLGPEIHARSADEDAKVINDYMIEGQSLLSQINDFFLGDETYYKKQRSFFMSNANGIVDVPRTMLQGSQTDAEKNPVAVKVDRILAKVRIYTNYPDTYQLSPATEESPEHYLTPDGVRIGTEVSAALNKTNMYTYLIRQTANLAPAAAGGPGGAETKNINTDRAFIYAKDPNFTNMRGASEEDLSAAFMGEKYNDTVKDIDDAEEGDARYILENTMDLDDQGAANYLDYTTHYVVTAYIAPKGIAMNKSYYSYINQHGNPKVFTHEEAMDWLEEDEFPTDMSDLKAILEDINADTDPESKFDFTVDSEPDVYELTSEKGITFHYRGINIYTVPIKHFQPLASANLTDPRKELYGYYGVVRNNYYTVKITGFKGPGTGGSGWISADITINEWYLRDQEEEL